MRKGPFFNCSVDVSAFARVRKLVVGIVGEILSSGLMVVLLLIRKLLQLNMYLVTRLAHLCGSQICKPQTVRMYLGFRRSYGGWMQKGLHKAIVAS